MKKNIRKNNLYSNQPWRNYMTFKYLCAITALPPHQMKWREKSKTLSQFSVFAGSESESIFVENDAWNHSYRKAEDSVLP